MTNLNNLLLTAGYKGNVKLYLVVNDVNGVVYKQKFKFMAIANSLK
jgi:hypothetical protein